jgi:hypothetical protein
MPAIYAGTNFAICLLEVLVHANRKTPRSGARSVEAVVPGDESREVFPEAAHPGGMIRSTPRWRRASGGHGSRGSGRLCWWRPRW